NGTDIQLEKDMTLREMMNAINSSDADVSMTYSELSDTIRLTSTQTGSGRDVDIQDSELARKLFGTGKGNEGNITIEKGQDAVLDVTVNGDSMTLTRSSNEVNIDGLKVTLKDEFGYDDKGVLVKGEEVSFTSAPK